MAQAAESLFPACSTLHTVHKLYVHVVIATRVASTRVYGTYRISATYTYGRMQGNGENH